MVNKGNQQPSHSFSDVLLLKQSWNTCRYVCLWEAKSKDTCSAEKCQSSVLSMQYLPMLCSFI